jgi:hypothetical protein
MREFGLEGVFSTACDKRDWIRSTYVPFNYAYRRNNGELETLEKYQVLEAVQAGSNISIVLVALMRPVDQRVDIVEGKKYEEVLQKTGENTYRDITFRTFERDKYFINDGVMLFVSPPVRGGEIHKCNEDIPQGLLR